MVAEYTKADKGKRKVQPWLSFEKEFCTNIWVIL